MKKRLKHMNSYIRLQKGILKTAIRLYPKPQCLERNEWIQCLAANGR